jgi:hypothetical protein
MNKNITTLFFVLLFITAQKSFSQNWVIGGNSVPANAKFGSTNNRPVIFISHNIERARFLPTGELGIGTSSPLAKLHVDGGAGIPLNGLTGGYIIAGPGTGSQLALDFSQIQARVGNTAYNTLFLNNGGGDISLAGSLMYLSRSKNFIGIGSGNPQARFQIFNGTDASLGGGGYLVNGSTASTNMVLDDNEIMARNNGSASTLFLNFEGGDVNVGNGRLYIQDVSGDVAVGTTTTSGFRLRVNESNGSLGFDILNSTLSQDWEFFTGNGAMILNENGNLKGSFNATNGVYSAVSDERLKTNIQPMRKMLDKIDQLKPVSYQFKNTGDQQVYNGFLAQDVMKIFPSLVTHNVINERSLDMYTLDYSGFGVIAIKGIQELQQTISDQQQTITALEERITKLETAIAAIITDRSSQANNTKDVVAQ